MEKKPAARHALMFGETDFTGMAVGGANAETLVEHGKLSRPGALA
jgi:hypothetical protein